MLNDILQGGSRILVTPLFFCLDVAPGEDIAERDSYGEKPTGFRPGDSGGRHDCPYEEIQICPCDSHRQQ